MKNFKIKGIVFSRVAILTIANSTIISHADVAVENSPTLSGTPADIPSDASQIISDTEDYVEYKIADGGEIQDSTGQDIQIPVTVSTNIQESSDGVISGETTYTAKLEEAEIVEDSLENPLLSSAQFFKNGLFGINAFAQTSNTGTYTHDKGNHVSISTTVNWSSSGISKKINYVTGNYYIFTSGFGVKSASVKVGESNLIQYPNISKVWNLGGAHNWRVNCNYPYRSTSGRGASGGANYYMTISNGRTSYAVTLYNTVWG
ncbi:hypothetical protein [Lactococcus garvieae]|uniref:hypothetical protein n=1 Tax=Lactococcus garvieae TaxID=1363 RepID=UPI0038529DC8